MVVQQVGAGCTMVFAVDTTWRWRMVVGGFTGDSSFYQRFWGQLVRWLSTQEEEPPPLLRVSTDRYQYEPGQIVQLEIDLAERIGVANDTPQPQTNDAAPKTATAWRVAAVALDEQGRQVPLLPGLPSYPAGRSSPVKCTAPSCGGIQYWSVCFLSSCAANGFCAVGNGWHRARQIEN